MIRIAFVGAGSVVFTRQLLHDILSYPELSGAAIALHDIDPERLQVAAALAGHAARTLGAEVEVTATTDRRAALEGADVVVNMIAVGGHQATLTDFEIPAAAGLRQTIGDTLGVGGIFRALRTFPVLQALAEDMAAVCPDAWLLNYTNPMAMNIQYLTHDRAEAEGRGAVPLGVLDGARALRHHRRPARGGRRPVRRGEPPGVDPALAAPGPRPVSGAGRRHRRQPRTWPAASASTCTGAWATTRRRPASTPRSTCPGTSATTAR